MARSATSILSAGCRRIATSTFKKMSYNRMTSETSATLIMNIMKVQHHFWTQTSSMKTYYAIMTLFEDLESGWDRLLGNRDFD
jgi:hypothetical protein